MFPLHVSLLELSFTKDHRLSSFDKRDRLPTSLEARSPRSKCQQSHIPSEGTRGGFLNASQFLVVAGNPWCSLVCRPIIPLSACHHTAFSLCVSVLCVFTWRCPCVCVSKISSSYTDASHWIKAHPNPVWPYINFITSAKTLLPNKVAFRGSWWMWILQGTKRAQYSTQYKWLVIALIL